MIPVFYLVLPLLSSFLCLRVVGLTGVDVAKEVKNPEEDPVEDQNDNTALLT